MNRRSSKKSTATRATKPVKLRIIGGEMRGRIVPYHGEQFTRPMKDNIRENLFNILGPRIRGSIAFDLFAGTGALGLEALSRGSQRVKMIEQNRRAAQLIRDTAETFGVADRTLVLIGDAFRLGSEILSPPADDTPWIVFLCPPYALWTEKLDELGRLIQTVHENAPPGSILMAETERSFDHGKLPSADWDLRSYGGTTLAFSEPASKCGMTF